MTEKRSHGGTMKHAKIGKGGYVKAKEKSGGGKKGGGGKQHGKTSGYGAEASCPSSSMKQQGKESY